MAESNLFDQLEEFLPKHVSPVPSYLHASLAFVIAGLISYYLAGELIVSDFTQDGRVTEAEARAKKYVQIGGSRHFTPKCNTKQSLTKGPPLFSFRHATMGYCAERSDFLFRRLHCIKNEGMCMSEERLLFEIERILLDNVQVLGLVKDDPSTLDFLFNLLSNMGNSRLGIPPHKNVHSAVECAENSNYQQLLENMIRPAMYSLNTESTEGAEAAVFIYRCFNAASAIAMYDCHRVPVYDFHFAVDTARKARDVVGEWLGY